MTKLPILGLLVVLAVHSIADSAPRRGMGRRGGMGAGAGCPILRDSAAFSADQRAAHRDMRARRIQLHKAVLEYSKLRASNNPGTQAKRDEVLRLIDELAAFHRDRIDLLADGLARIDSACPGWSDRMRQRMEQDCRGMDCPMAP